MEKRKKNIYQATYQSSFEKKKRTHSKFPEFLGCNESQFLRKSIERIHR